MGETIRVLQFRPGFIVTDGGVARMDGRDGYIEIIKSTIGAARKKKHHKDKPYYKVMVNGRWRTGADDLEEARKKARYHQMLNPHRKIIEAFS